MEQTKLSVSINSKCIWWMYWLNCQTKRVQNITHKYSQQKESKQLTKKYLSPAYNASVMLTKKKINRSQVLILCGAPEGIWTCKREQRDLQIYIFAAKKQKTNLPKVRHYPLLHSISSIEFTKTFMWKGTAALTPAKPLQTLISLMAFVLGKATLQLEHLQLFQTWDHPVFPSTRPRTH